MSYMLIHTNQRNISINKLVLFRLFYFEMFYWSDPKTLVMMPVLIQ
jgi:hypothetical protein